MIIALMIYSCVAYIGMTACLGLITYQMWATLRMNFIDISIFFTYAFKTQATGSRAVHAKMSADGGERFKAVSMVTINLNSTTTTTIFHNQSIHLLYLKRRADKGEHYESCVKFVKHHGAQKEATRMSEKVQIVIVDPVATKLELYQKHALGDCVCVCGCVQVSRVLLCACGEKTRCNNSVN